MKLFSKMKKNKSDKEPAELTPELLKIQGRICFDYTGDESYLEEGDKSYADEPQEKELETR